MPRESSNFLNPSRVRADRDLKAAVAIVEKSLGKGYAAKNPDLVRHTVDMINADRDRRADLRKAGISPKIEDF